MAQNRKTAKGKPANAVRASNGSKKPFYVILALAAIVAIATLSYLTSQSSKNKIITLDPNLPPVTSQGYVLGSPDAKVELVEFGDFECPACSNYSELAEPDIRAKYINTGKVRFRFIDYPLNMHRNTLNASAAAACADEQGKFWEMHDLLYTTQYEWNGEVNGDPDKYFKKTLAPRIQGLDAGKLSECIDSRRTLPKVQSHLKLGTDRAVASTPTFVVGDKQFLLRAGDHVAQVSEMLDAALAAANAPATTKKP